MLDNITTPRESGFSKFRNSLRNLRERTNAVQQNVQMNKQLGAPNPALFCQHCQTKGHVRVKCLKAKQGISGGKATGAILTGGLSLFAVGLSRKESVTQATCGNCRSTWRF